MSLNSIFKQRKLEQLIQVFPKRKNYSQLVENSAKRVSQSMNLQNSGLLANAIQNGIIPLVHESQHVFRERTKQKEIHLSGDLTLKNLQPSRERALTMQ